MSDFANSAFVVKLIRLWNKPGKQIHSVPGYPIDARLVEDGHTIEIAFLANRLHEKVADEPETWSRTFHIVDFESGKDEARFTATVASVIGFSKRLSDSRFLFVEVA